MKNNFFFFASLFRFFSLSTSVFFFPRFISPSSVQAGALGETPSRAHACGASAYVGVERRGKKEEEREEAGESSWGSMVR